MKILKCLVFLSILSGIFFVIYRQSDEKGFRKWRTLFSIAAVIAASVAGLIPVNSEAVEPVTNANQAPYERVLSEQELDSLDDSDRQVILARVFSPPVTSPTNCPPRINSMAPTPRGSSNRPVYVPKHRTAPKTVNPGLGAGANPGGAGGGGGNAKFDDDKRPTPNKKQSQAAKAYDYNSHYQPQKKLSEDQCPGDEQNKAGIDELPDSSEYRYNLETKTAKKALRNVWKNTQAKKEVLDGLDRINKGELLPRNQKNFKGFKTLNEIKLNDTRMLVQPRKNGDPDKIVAIFMRRDLDNIASIFKKKYK